MKPIKLVGANGDEIDLCTTDIFVAPGAVFGTSQITVDYRPTRYGRRIQKLSHDVIRSAFTIRVHATTQTELDEKRERVVDALRSRTEQARAVLVIERGDGTRRAQIGVDVGDSPAQTDTRATVAQIPVVLESVERPYWLTLESTEVATTIGVSASLPWTGEMPMDAAGIDLGWTWDLAGYYIEGAAARTLTLLNPGPLPTWPEWVITGPATSVQLAHERTGIVTEWVEPSPNTLAVNASLVIITDPRHGRNVSIQAVPAWSGVSVTSEMSQLLPGVNRVQIRVLGGVDPDTTVTCRYHTRHASP